MTVKHIEVDICMMVLLIIFAYQHTS